MGGLSMEHPWAFAFGLLGNIISFTSLLAPIPTFYRIFKSKSTEGFQSVPYVVALFSAMLWIFYALVKTGEGLLITINAAGCVIETVYIVMYLVYAPRKAKILHDHIHREFQPESTPMGVWLRAMGCSLLVSMASLVCLILLPVILFQGKPSKDVVDALAVFGAGAMLGDSFLHQLPHAFGGGQSHSHNHEDHDHAHEHSHAHSLKDLSVGLSILFGIVLFFIVEKIVRYVEDNSQRGGHSHGHHHHHHKRQDISDKAKSGHIKSDDEGKDTDQAQQNSLHDGATGKIIDAENEQESNATKEAVLGSQRSALDVVPGATDREPINSETDPAPGKALSSEDPSVSNSNLVFGYLNLFSDGVHNFTDGMALGSAFLLHGSVGGWSRTLFLLAHELPQEIEDFGILVRSGFTVSKALFFNFLSALVALGGTALALSLGTDPGHSSLIEGFTAGGFIYIAVAGVLPQMHDQKTTLSNSMCQLIFLTMGMLVALGISLVE